MENAVGWQQMGSDYAEARGIKNAEGQCTRRHLSRPYKSRRHHHKPYAGGMLPAYFPVATTTNRTPGACSRLQHHNPHLIAGRITHQQHGVLERERVIGRSQARCNGIHIGTRGQA